MQAKRKATVIGGSIGGLAVGLALLQKGWDVNIFEATREKLDGRGAGIITHPSLEQALNLLSIPTEEALGIAITSRKAFARDGTIFRSIELPQIATSWGRLYRRLLKQFPANRYHMNKVLEQISQSDQTVEASFSDGTSVSSDLLVGADGIRSTVRAQLEPSATPQYAGYVAWRGLINEQDLTDSEKQDIFPHFTFCLPNGEQVLTYPVAGEAHQIAVGQRRCNIVWYRPAARDSTLRDLLTDINGDNNGTSIAPDKVRSEVISSMQNDATYLLSPQHNSLMMKIERPFLQPIYDLTTTTMVHHRIALLGDAAYTARPHLAIGTTKAMDDAIALADALSKPGTVDCGLNHYDKLRRPINSELVERSRQLGAYLQAQLLSEDEKRNAQRHRSVNAVLVETANPGS